MADDSKSATEKLVEKSTQIPIVMGQGFASTLNEHKENCVKRNSERSNNVVTRLKRCYEEISKSQKNLMTVSGDNFTGTGAIKKRVMDKEERIIVAKNRVRFVDNNVENLYPVIGVLKKRFENEDNKCSGSKKRSEFGDENQKGTKKRFTTDVTEKEGFTKPRFKVWADELPPSKQEAATKNSAVKSNKDLATGEKLSNQRLGRLISESGTAAPDRLTPIDVRGAPLVPKKIKVTHRHGAQTTSETTKNTRMGSTWIASPYWLPYENNFVEFELAKEKSLPRIAKGLRKMSITEEQRKIILKFLIHLNTHNFYPSFLLYQAVRIFDAVLDVKRISIENMQLVALASMWIALKREQITYKVPLATEMISYSKDLYQGRVDLLIRCEMELLQALSFKIVFPDPFSVLYYYITACNRSQFLSENQVEVAYYCGGYMIDLSLFDEDLMQVSAILLAAAAAETALFFAIEEVKYKEEPMYFKWRSPDAASRFRDTEISSVSTKLINLINTSSIRHTEGEVVFKKYSRSRYCKVARFLCTKIRLFLGME